MVLRRGLPGRGNGGRRTAAGRLRRYNIRSKTMRAFNAEEMSGIIRRTGWTHAARMPRRHGRGPRTGTAPEDGRVQCDVCPRACRLQEGQRRFVLRKDALRAKDAQIVLTTYGRSSGFCVDPIEKKPLNHFLPEVGRALVSAPRDATSAAGSARTGDISKIPGDRHAGRIRPHRPRSPDAAARLDCNSVAFTYNDWHGDLPRACDG